MQTRALTAVSQLTDAFSRARTLEEAYAAALNAIQTGLGVARASVLLFDTIVRRCTGLIVRQAIQRRGLESGRPGRSCQASCPATHRVRARRAPAAGGTPALLVPRHFHFRA